MTTETGPDTDKPWTYNLDVKVTPPPVATSTEILRVRCGDYSAYVARRHPEGNWTVTRDNQGRDSIVPTGDTMTYDQAVTWATNRVTFLATQMLAGRAAARAAAAEWPDPATPASADAHRDRHL